jgi:hypothetical protein
VDHRIEGVIGEQDRQRRRVAQIGLHEARLMPGNVADARERRPLAVLEIVDDDDIVPGGEELDAGVAADVTGATGD